MLVNSHHVFSQGSSSVCFVRSAFTHHPSTPLIDVSNVQHVLFVGLGRHPHHIHYSSALLLLKFVDLTQTTLVFFAHFVLLFLKMFSKFRQGGFVVLLCLITLSKQVVLLFHLILSLVALDRRSLRDCPAYRSSAHRGTSQTLLQLFNLTSEPLAVVL